MPQPHAARLFLNKTLFADLVCACTFDIAMTNSFFEVCQSTFLMVWLFSLS